MPFHAVTCRHMPSHVVTCRHMPSHAVTFRYVPLRTVQFEFVMGMVCKLGLLEWRDVEPFCKQFEQAALPAAIPNMTVT